MPTPTALLRIAVLAKTSAEVRDRLHAAVMRKTAAAATFRAPRVRPSAVSRAAGKVLSAPGVAGTAGRGALLLGSAGIGAAAGASAGDYPYLGASLGLGIGDALIRGLAGRAGNRIGLSAVNRRGNAPGLMARAATLSAIHQKKPNMLLRHPLLRSEAIGGVEFLAHELSRDPSADSDPDDSFAATYLSTTVPIFDTLHYAEDPNTPLPRKQLPDEFRSPRAVEAAKDWAKLFNMYARSHYDPLWHAIKLDDGAESPMVRAHELAHYYDPAFDHLRLPWNRQGDAETAKWVGRARQTAGSYEPEMPAMIAGAATALTKDPLSEYRNFRAPMRSGDWIYEAIRRHGPKPSADPDFTPADREAIKKWVGELRGGNPVLARHYQAWLESHRRMDDDYRTGRVPRPPPAFPPRNPSGISTPQPLPKDYNVPSRWLMNLTAQGLRPDQIDAIAKTLRRESNTQPYGRTSSRRAADEDWAEGWLADREWQKNREEAERKRAEVMARVNAEVAKGRNRDDVWNEIIAEAKAARNQ